MSDYGETGAMPVEDACCDDPPTISDVVAAQQRDHPEQANVEPTRIESPEFIAKLHDELDGDR